MELFQMRVKPNLMPVAHYFVSETYLRSFFSGLGLGGRAQ